MGVVKVMVHAWRLRLIERMVIHTMCAVVTVTVSIRIGDGMHARS